MGKGFEEFLQHLPEFSAVLFSAAGMTVVLTLAGGALALMLGLALAVLRTLPSRAMRRLVTTYVDIARSTPTLTLLFIIYFGLPQVGVRFDPVVAAIVGFGLHGAAYVTEIFRAGIEGVDRGQSEAGIAIGLPRLDNLRYIVLPQAVRVALPPLCNYLVQLLKDSSIASTVAVPELMFRARMLADQTYLTDQIYLFVAGIYLLMSLPLSYAVKRLEIRLNRGHLAP